MPVVTIRSPIPTSMITPVDPRPSPFSSPEALRAAFAAGLERLLTHDLLGTFILVLGNASYDRAQLEPLRGALGDAFARWEGRFARQSPRVREAAVDDIAVFERLRSTAIDALPAMQRRAVGPWSVQLNPLRALRPPRMSGTAVTRLHRPFDRDGFHFDRPVLRREVFWEGTLGALSARLLYNKFPFADLHTLLVPHPQRGLPQWLDRQTHVEVWDTLAMLGEALPDIGAGYNAQGAYASVNHLHLQMFLRRVGDYPIEAAEWRHNGGPCPYPLAVTRHIDARTAWEAIERLHAAGATYNLLYRPGHMYLVTRAFQGSYRHSPWTAGFAWSEVAGEVVVAEAAVFAALTEQAIDQELGLLVV